MKRTSLVLPVQGVIGGILAAAAVALWFLLVDLAMSRPFHTPTVLAQALLGEGMGDGTTRTVVTYTLLHFGSFALLGAATALLLPMLKVAPGLLVGAVVGVGLLNSVYYATLFVTGANLGTLLGSHVVFANLLAGMVLTTYLHYATGAENRLGLGYLRDHTLLAQGLVTGLIGAGSVALWFLVLDVLRGAPFMTPAALGSLVFLGITNADEIQITVGIIAAYTVLHVSAFALVGIALVWAAHQLEHLPELWLMGFMAFVILEGAVLFAAGGVGEWILGELSWWALGIANLLAMTAMVAWIWATRSELRHRLLATPLLTKV